MADGNSLSAIAGEVLRVMLEMKNEAKNLRKDLERLQKTLKRVVPPFENSRILDLDSNRRRREGLEKLIAKLREGEKLVQKCSNVPWWNIYLSIRYSRKIIKLDETILRFCQPELQVEIRRDNIQMMPGNRQLVISKVEGEGLIPQMMRDLQQLRTKVEGLTSQKEKEVERPTLQQGRTVDEEGLILIIFSNAAGKLLHVILEMKDRAINFRVELEGLRDTIERAIPLFEDWVILDLELNDQKRQGLEKLIGQLRKGEELVEECSEIPSSNTYMKDHYSNKIIKLDGAILKFCNRELMMEMWRSKQLMRDVQPSSFDVNKLLTAVPELPDCVVGFDSPLKELRKELFREDVTVLGLCGPRGCGKSTLAAMLCRDKQVRGVFRDKIIFLTVSNTTKTLEILKLLLQEIGQVSYPNLSEENATRKFYNLLGQRESTPLLLVLDDVWDKSIIDKLFSRAKGYKMLVTSRKVFNIYRKKYHSKYLLKTLGHQDSMILFRQTALLQDGNVYFEPDEDLLNKIVRRCDGFPLAIMMIAKSLVMQPLVIWENMARKLMKGSSILDFDETLRNSHASSLDSLDNTVLECFLDLGFFPENQKIPASALIDIWSELYELEYADDAFVILLELASQNLVNLVGSRNIAKEIDANFNELSVTQHELFRDLAIYMNRQERKRLIMVRREIDLPESWRKEENHHLNARLVSLCTGEMCSESWYDLQFPEAEVLIVNFSARNYALPPFMQKMRKLKVLIIANCGRTHAEISNLKTVTEMANLKRIRLENVSIPSLHEITMPLMNLQKISFFMCDFSQALMKCAINASYFLTNLVEIDISYCHDLVELPPWICDIIHLQKLSISNCDNLFALPERIGFITDLELLRLCACTGLLELPDSICGLQKLRFLDISDCCDLEMLPDRMGELQCLRKLDMRGCFDLRTLPPSTMNLVHLKEVICDEEAASLWEPLSSRIKITFPRKENNLDWLGVEI